MGCFSLSKSKRRNRDRLLPASQPLSLIYGNKPTALPDPLEVETELYGRHLSAPPSFNDRYRNPPCTSPRASTESREQFARPRFTDAKNEFHDKARSKLLQNHGNGCIALCSKYVIPASKWRRRSVSASWNSGPLCGSSGHSGPLSASSYEADSQRCQDNFSARSWPPAPPRTSANPLPLPLPQDTSIQIPHVRHVTSASSLASSPCCSMLPSGSFRDFNRLPSGNQCMHPEPLPTPEKVINPCKFRSFTLEELATRCLDFSHKCCIGEACSETIYKTWIDEDCASSKREVAIVYLQEQCSQDDEEFVAHVRSLAEARNSHLCMLVGYSMEKYSWPIGDKVAPRKRLLIYEHLPNGTLDRHLYGRDDRPSLDWYTRIKVALDAARGLMELHDKFLDKAMYLDFRPFYIELDSNFSGKLTGYGLTKDFSLRDLEDKPSMISPYLAPETLQKGELSVQSTVWSFGVVLLELLTGRRNWDELFAAEERDLVKWCTGFLKDAAKLFRVIDPELKGRYPARDVKTVGSLALQCLQNDSHLRPNIGYVVEVLKSVHRRMPTPQHISRCEPAECTIHSASKRKSLKQALHELNPEDDLPRLSSLSEVPASRPVKMQGRLQGNSTNSLSRLSTSSRSSLSCSSSFALERKENSTICKVQASQTG
ncbi:hypothetical protein O6H91_08G030900 [Diphasiastrum complanatum]|uniref:Uncharacterized protein n=3 Tax=Diphasiastrum complanatum TaxID=34168 RepID=A0ACC2CX55_DIPCM|nr:hypothetical protein O6H91_08G030800 [Diphasiastrum complanatum]KAJ7546227.1 hypothetical protein O6H91_08G030800 [Diphasiastrum complanatum]KAJ7546228.1 hypothetical protein O6H91_08G030900 [Diphasiastrum complanatum]